MGDIYEDEGLEIGDQFGKLDVERLVHFGMIVMQKMTEIKNDLLYIVNSNKRNRNQITTTDMESERSRNAINVTRPYQNAKKFQDVCFKAMYLFSKLWYFTNLVEGIALGVHSGTDNFTRLITFSIDYHDRGQYALGNPIVSLEKNIRNNAGQVSFNVRAYHKNEFVLFTSPLREVTDISQISRFLLTKINLDAEEPLGTREMYNLIRTVHGACNTTAMLFKIMIGFYASMEPFGIPDQSGNLFVSLQRSKLNVISMYFSSTRPSSNYINTHPLYDVIRTLNDQALSITDDLQTLFRQQNAAARRQQPEVNSDDETEDEEDYQRRMQDENTRRRRGLEPNRRIYKTYQIPGERVQDEDWIEGPMNDWFPDYPSYVYGRFSPGFMRLIVDRNRFAAQRLNQQPDEMELRRFTKRILKA